MRPRSSLPIRSRSTCESQPQKEAMSATLLLEPEHAPGVATIELGVMLARPLAGFPRSRRFRLHGLGEAYLPFVGLSSLDEPLAFIVVAPGLFFDDYVFEVPKEDVELLGLDNSDDARVVVLVSRTPGAAPTANLMGPLVINRRSGAATQVVLSDGRYRAAVALEAERRLSGA